MATGSRTKKGQSVWRIASLVCSCANEPFFFCTSLLYLFQAIIIIKNMCNNEQ